MPAPTPGAPLCPEPDSRCRLQVLRLSRPAVSWVRWVGSLRSSETTLTGAMTPSSRIYWNSFSPQPGTPMNSSPRLPPGTGSSLLHGMGSLAGGQYQGELTHGSPTPPLWAPLTLRCACAPVSQELWHQQLVSALGWRRIQAPAGGQATNICQVNWDSMAPKRPPDAEATSRLATGHHCETS